MLEILVNEQRLDLAAGEQILFNYSINKIGEIKTRQGARTNDFEVLGSTRNKAILGFSDDINSSTRFPYKLQDCILKENGVDVSIGFLQVVSYNISNNTFDCAFFSSNTEWFEEVKKIDIKNGVDWSDTQHEWSHNIIASYLTNTENFTYPIIDYSESSSGSGLPNNTLTEVGRWFADQAYLATYTHSIITRVFEKINWKIEGEFLENPVYKREIIPYSLEGIPKVSDQVKNLYEVITSDDSGSKTITNTRPFQFQQLIKDNYNSLADIEDLPTYPGQFYTEHTAQITGPFRVSFSANITNNDGLEGLQIILQKDTGGGYADAGLLTFYAASESNTKSGTIELYLNSGDKLRVTSRATGAGLSYSFTYTNALWTITPFGEIQEGTDIDVSYFLPELTAGQLIKDLAIRYNLFFQANNYTKTVNVFTYEELKRGINNPVNWSGKLDMSAMHEIDYSEAVENWYKVSEFKYQETEDDSILINDFNTKNGLPLYGDGRISVDNDYIEQEGTVLESIFFATIQRIVVGFYVPFIRIIDNQTGTAEYTSGLRVMYVAPETSVEEFTDYSLVALIKRDLSAAVNLANAPFAWFQKEARNNTLDSYTHNLSFNLAPINNPTGTSLIEDYYTSFLRIIQDPVLVRASLILKAEDIANLDFSRPVFLPYPFKGCFFVQSIEDYTGAQDVTEVELILIR